MRDTDNRDYSGFDDSKARYDVFISHSSSSLAKHRRLVDDLAYVLRQLGLKVFLDRTELIEGKDLDDSLRTAIKAATVGLIVLTHKALASVWVRREINQMQRQWLACRMRIMVLRLEEGCQVPEGVSPEDVFDLKSPVYLAEIADEVKKAASK